MSFLKQQTQITTTSTTTNGGRHLDRWRKVEDNTNGVTQFWPVVVGGQQQQRHHNNNNNNHNHNNHHHHHYHQQHRLIRPIVTVKQHKVIVQPLSSIINNATNYPIDHHYAQQNYHNRQNRTTNNNNNHRNQHHQSTGSPIWSAAGSSYHTRPQAVVRKPRTRRILRNLLCCLGGAKSPDDPVPLSPVLATDHYSPKTLENLLLPPIRSCDYNKKCLIIDLDETLVHSSFKPVKNPDFIIPVEIDGVIHQVYVLKRPHVDEFLQRIGGLYECILFTASLAKYADPVADLLDRWGVFRTRLFREACVFHKGNYVKDLNRLGRDLKRVLIIDNSPASYAFHPDNAIPVQSWFDDAQDNELLRLLPFLEKMAKVDNMYPLLRTWNSTSGNSNNKPPPLASSSSGNGPPPNANANANSNVITYITNNTTSTGNNNENSINTTTNPISSSSSGGNSGNFVDRLQTYLR